jgi:hypothetical protein
MQSQAAPSWHLRAPHLPSLRVSYWSIISFLEDVT